MPGDCKERPGCNSTGRDRGVLGFYLPSRIRRREDSFYSGQGPPDRAIASFGDPPGLSAPTGRGRGICGWRDPLHKSILGTNCPFLDQGGLVLSHVLTVFLQRAPCGATLENHPEAAPGPECNGGGSGCSIFQPCYTTVAKVALWLQFKMLIICALLKGLCPSH